MEMNKCACTLFISDFFPPSKYGAFISELSISGHFAFSVTEGGGTHQEMRRNKVALLVCSVFTGVTRALVLWHSLVVGL